MCPPPTAVRYTYCREVSVDFVSESVLRARLTVIAEAEIVNSGAKLSEPAHRLLNELITNGARQLARDGRATEGDVLTVEPSLRQLTRRLTELDQKHSDMGAGLFDFLKDLLCPLYPFC